MYKTMKKSDIYEHLANIYLDTPLKRKRKIESNNDNFRVSLYISISVIVILSLLLFINVKSRYNNPVNSETTLVLMPEAAKINFQFNPGRKEVFAINLNKSNLSKYKRLGLSLKKARAKDVFSLRVEFTNAFKEKSEVYLKDITADWKEYKIALTDFKAITDWTEVSSLAFILEEWNAQEKKGVFYLDNVALFK